MGFVSTKWILMKLVFCFKGGMIRVDQFVTTLEAFVIDRTFRFFLEIISLMNSFFPNKSSFEPLVPIEAKKQQ